MEAAHRDRDDAAARINKILADARAVPYLVRQEPLDWHVHAVEPDRPLATRIAVETAMAMIEVVRRGLPDRPLEKAGPLQGCTGSIGCR